MNKTYERLIKECDQRGIDRIKVGELTYVNKLAKKVKRLQEENKRLKKDKGRVVSEREDLLSSCLYQDKIIKKAIEYIERKQEDINNGGNDMSYCQLTDLLEILRGEDSE